MVNIVIGGGGGASSLQEAFDGGQTINLDSRAVPIALTNTGVNNVLTSNGITILNPAGALFFDPSGTGLTATTVPAALAELDSNITAEDLWDLSANSIVPKVPGNNVSITIPDTFNRQALILTQNDITNNPNALDIINTGSGDSLQINTTDLVIAGNGQISIGTATPDGSALLQLDSTTQGFLPPRMTTVERDLITPTAGLTIFNTTTSELETYNGSVWEKDSAERFTELVDTPNSYTGEARRIVRVNAAETDLEFVNTISLVEATVGPTLGDYITVSAAFAAGVIRVRVIENTTETADLNWGTTSRVVYVDQEVVWNLDDVVHSGNSSITIIGSNRSDSILRYAKTVNAQAITLNSGIARLENIKVDNNSTSANTPIFNSGSSQLITNVEFALPNLDGTGINSGSGDSQFSNITLNGGGTSCYNALVISGTGAGSSVAVNITLTGLFDAFSPNYAIVVGQFATLSGLTESTTGNTAIAVNGGIIDNIVDPSGGVLRVYCSGNDSIISNFRATSGVVNFNGKDNCRLINSRIDNAEMGSAGSVNNMIDNCEFTGSALTDIDGDNYLISNTSFASDISIDPTAIEGNFSNCKFAGDVTITSGANFHQFSNCKILGNISISGNDTSITGCRVGTITGGSTETITINAGATRTIVNGCRTDAAISDSGTNSTLSANVVY